MAMMTDDPQMADEALRSYYRRVQAIGEWILSLCNTGKGGPAPLWMEDRLSESINPFYCQVEPGGLMLEFYYGMPSKFGTPLGELAIGGSGSGYHDRVHGAIRERLGCVEVRPHYISEMGEHGPWWAITRDLDGGTFPAYRARTRDAWIGYDEAREIWLRVKAEGRN